MKFEFLTALYMSSVLRNSFYLCVVNNNLDSALRMKATYSTQTFVPTYKVKQTRLITINWPSFTEHTLFLRKTRIKAARRSYVRYCIVLKSVFQSLKVSEQWSYSRDYELKFMPESCLSWAVFSSACPGKDITVSHDGLLARPSQPSKHISQLASQSCNSHGIIQATKMKSNIAEFQTSSSANAVHVFVSCGTIISQVSHNSNSSFNINYGRQTHGQDRKIA